MLTKVIGKAWNCSPKIALGLILFPFLRQFNAISANNGEARSEAGVKACCTTDDVQFYVISVFGDDSRLINRTNVIPNRCYVVA